MSFFSLLDVCLYTLFYFSQLKLGFILKKKKEMYGRRAVLLKNVGTYYLLVCSITHVVGDVNVMIVRIVTLFVTHDSFLFSESLYEDEKFDQHQRQLAALLVSKVNEVLL